MCIDMAVMKMIRSGLELQEEQTLHSRFKSEVPISKQVKMRRGEEKYTSPAFKRELQA